MQEVKPNIDDITDSVSVCIEKLFKEYAALAPSLDLKSDPLKGVAWVGFHLGREYFITARDILHGRRVVGGGTVVRTCIENMAALYYIYCTPGKTTRYAKAYIESLEKFRQVALSTREQGTATMLDARQLKQAVKWANTKGIEDWVKASGAAFTSMYELFSYFSHPNPGTITYLVNKELRDRQLHLLKQTNCLTALSLMALVLGYSSLTTVTIEELDDVARALGTQLAPKG